MIQEKKTWLDQESDEEEEELPEYQAKNQVDKPAAVGQEEQYYDEQEGGHGEYDDHYDGPHYKGRGYMPHHNEEQEFYNEEGEVDPVFGAQRQGNVQYRKKQGGGSRYKGPREPYKKDNYRKEQQYPKEGGGYQKEGKSKFLRTYKYEDLDEEFRTPVNMIYFEWGRITAFIQNKDGPYKIEMHIKSGAEATGFTEEAVRQGIPEANVSNIRVAGPKGEHFSIFMACETNEDMHNIGRMARWEIKGNDNGLYEFEIFLHKKSKQEFEKEKWNQDKRRPKPSKSQAGAGWLPGFGEKKKPDFFTSSKKAEASEIEEEKKQQLEKPSREDPFGGLVPRDETQFKREPLQTQAERPPRKIIPRGDESWRTQKERKQQERLQKGPARQAQSNKELEGEKSSEMQLADEKKAALEDKAREGKEERKRPEAEQQEKKEEGVRAPKVPKLDEISHYKQRVGGGGAQNEYAYSAYGDDSQSMVSFRSSQTTKSRKMRPTYFKKRQDDRAGPPPPRYANQSYRQQELHTEYKKVEGGGAPRDEEHQGQQQHQHQHQQQYYPRGGYREVGGLSYLTQARGGGRGRGGRGGRQYRGSYRGRGDGGGGYRGGRGGGHYQDRPYVPKQQSQQLQQEKPYDGPPALYKEESSMSATSAAGMKVKKLRAVEEEPTKKTAAKKGKKDGGFKNRFADLN